MCVPLGLGLGNIDQDRPFQCSAKVPIERPPTAKQFAVLGHETPCRLVAEAPRGFAMIDQPLPVQCSINCVVCRAADCQLPTAKQLDALVHATPPSPAATEPEGLGLAVIVQTGSA